MKKKISGIYKIENLINHKVYIGQSKDINTRWNRHRTNEHNIHLKRAFEKYGIENFSFEILIETYDLDYWEIFLIQIYHATDDRFGYNLTIGGNVLRGKYNPFYGKHHSKENNLKNAKSHHYKSIRCVETGMVFESASEISKIYNICKSHVIACCKGLQITCGGFHWVYEGENYVNFNIRRGKSYYFMCKDPVKNDICYYYTLANRMRRHRNLYNNVKIGDCVIFNTKNREEFEFVLHTVLNL